MRPSRRSVLAGAAGAALVPGCGAPVSAGRDTALPPVPSGRVPNLLVVFPDQLRAMSLPAFGDASLVLPAIERLYAEGVSLDHMVSQTPVCTPARSSILTGLQAYHTGTSENELPLPSGTPSLGWALAEGGWKRGWVGKWHLDGPGSGDFGYVPLNRRFFWDHFWFANNFNHRYLDATWFEDVDVPIRAAGVWAPTVETDAALAAIDAFGDDPFALVLSYGPPHPDPAWPTNWDDVPPELMAEVDPLALQLRPNLPTEMLYPNKKLEGNQLDPTGALAFLQGYYACILGVDREIGRLLDGLDARGLTQDTLVVFLSDHGEMGGSQSRYRKGVAYEEVVRVPFVARWPGVLAPARVAGAANLTDVTPTILGLLGAPPLVGATGRDRSSWLRNGAAPDAAESSFLWYHEVEGAWRGLRSARWKYAEAEIGDLLFDLEADPYEMTNLATDPDYAEVVEARAAELDALQEEAADPLLSV